MGDFLRNVTRTVTDWITPGPAPQRRRQTPAPQPPQQCPAPPRDQNSTRRLSTASLARGDVSFPQTRGMSAPVRALYDAIRAYPDSKATEAQAREIAQNVYDASRTFGVDSRVMLAIIAHESGGFDPNAESHSGAKGLGQLTGVAIDEVRRLSYDPTFPETRRVQREHYPVESVRNQLERPAMQAIFQRIDRSEANRFDISDNIWTSTAYARIVMDRAAQWGASAPVMGMNGMLGRYNSAGGTEQREYDDKVAAAYRTMFNTSIPANLSTR